VDANDALVLSQRLWQKIELQRRGTGVDEPRNAPRGVHGYLDYYRGIHTLRFASQEFEEFHLGRYAGFTDNWCAPVIDATAERLNSLGIRLGAETREADAKFQRVMDANDADRGLSEAFTVALAAGRSYGMVWGDREDENTPLVTFEHPEFCTIAYDADTRRPTADAKAWNDEKQGFLTLHTADEVWKWQWSVPQDNDPKRQVVWEPRQGSQDDTWPIPNPLGMPPMVEFRNSALLDDRPISDLAGVAAMQDAINLVWAYLFNSLDFASLPQRVAMGADFPKIPILDADGQQVGEKPADLKKMVKDRVLWLTGDNAKIDSWPSAALDVFAQVVSLCVDHIAAQTRTPPHYLIGKMANMAAEALTVAETGLVAKVVQRSVNFTRPQRELYRRIALAQGDKDRAEQARTGTIVWQDPQYRSLAQKIDAFTKFRASGLPLEYLLEWYGLAPADVDRILAMAKKENDILLTAKPEQAPPGLVLPRGFNQVALPDGAKLPEPTVTP
jgi:SPP1 Gp6-like portal protein